MTDEEITKRIRESLAMLGWTSSLGQVHYEGTLRLGFTDEYWSLNVNDLLALANGIDGCIDTMKAMIKDLQEESAAFQRGVEEGRRQCRKELLGDLPLGTQLVINGPESAVVVGQPLRGLCPDEMDNTASIQESLDLFREGFSYLEARDRTLR